MRTPLVVAASLLVVALAASRAAPMPGGKSRAQPRRALTVTGSLRWLYPGARRRLVLTVGNTRRFPIRVVSLTVGVGNAGPGCQRGNLRAGRLHRSLFVPGRSTRAAVLYVEMLRTAPDACKRAVFPLRFTAQGVRA